MADAREVGKHRSAIDRTKQRSHLTFAKSQIALVIYLFYYQQIPHFPYLCYTAFHLLSIGHLGHI